MYLLESSENQRFHLFFLSFSDWLASFASITAEFICAAISKLRLLQHTESSHVTTEKYPKAVLINQTVVTAKKMEGLGFARNNLTKCSTNLASFMRFLVFLVCIFSEGTRNSNHLETSRHLMRIAERSGQLSLELGQKESYAFQTKDPQSRMHWMHGGSPSNNSVIIRSD